MKFSQWYLSIWARFSARETLFSHVHQSVYIYVLSWGSLAKTGYIFILMNIFEGKMASCLGRLFQQLLLAEESRSFRLYCIHFLPDSSSTFLAKVIINSFAALQSALQSGQVLNSFQFHFRLHVVCNKLFSKWMQDYMQGDTHNLE